MPDVAAYHKSIQIAGVALVQGKEWSMRGLSVAVDRKSIQIAGCRF
jgi:hypothetical protein